MRDPTTNSTMFSLPAKAMLFGEFGVLFGFPAVACAFLPPHFSIRTDLLDACSPGKKILIESPFYPSGFSDDDPFFLNLIQPWQDCLAGKTLKIQILSSFSPALGFGSSSALIAGVSQGLWKIFYPEKTDFLKQRLFWEKVRMSLKQIQGAGSGYDIGVQLYAGQQTRQNQISFWKYENQPHHSVPLVQEILIERDVFSKYGCFLKTHIYSDTQRQITDFQKKQDKETSARDHAHVVGKFLTDFSLENLKNLMDKSRKIALAQHLFPFHNSGFQSLYQHLEENQIPFKTMGSGNGDCLWVLANRKKLIEKGLISSDDIAFAFEDFA